MVSFSELKIHLADLPHVAQMGAAPDAPPERRLLLARAAVPMSPVDLIATLGFLTGDESELVARSAVSTLESLPVGVLDEGLKMVENPAVLDVIARKLPRSRSDLLETIVQNRSASDDTVGWVVSRAEGNVIDIVAKNQLRIQRSPKIVEAIYFNPNARMGLVLNLLEDAVRLGVDVSSIPGYEEIVASIHGKDVAAPQVSVEGVEVVDAGPETGTDDLQPDAGPDAEQPDAIVVDNADFAGLVDDDAPGVDDDTFAALLEQGSVETGGEGSGENPEESGPLAKNLLAEIAKMSVPQKVRMALLGNETVRKQLIRDTRRVVFMSVLKSPRLTEKEISDFSKNKALHEDVIRFIAGNREWTSSYTVKAALVANPKCPPILAVNFLRLMTTKDIKYISKSHDVPGYVVRAAKGILANREAGKRS